MKVVVITVYVYIVYYYLFCVSCHHFNIVIHHSISVNQSISVVIFVLFYSSYLITDIVKQDSQDVSESVLYLNMVIVMLYKGM